MKKERSREEERALIIAVIVSEREYSTNITSAVLRNEPLMEKVVRLSEMEYREEGAGLMNPETRAAKVREWQQHAR